jgi:hypothetical protein
MSPNTGLISISISDIIINNTNYTLATYGYTSANILPASLYAYFSGGEKIYDNTKYTTNLVDISYIFVGLYNNDQVTISSLIGTFKQRTVGQVFIDISNIILTGPDSYNYRIVEPQPFLSYIYPYEITATFRSIPKIYDYSYDATYYTIGTLSGIFDSNDVTLSFISTYNMFTIGNQIIDISNIILSGNDSFNYYILPKYSIEGQILQKPLELIFSKGTKIYDGTDLEFNLVVTLSGILGLDIVSISGYTTIFKTNQSGYQLIDISNFIISGINSFNYYIPPIQAYLGYIRPKGLVISYVNSQQEYTAIPYTNYNVTYNDFVPIDSPLSLSGILQFAVSTNNILSEGINWVIVGNDGCIYYSIDGNTWLKVTNSPFTIAGCVATNNSMWLAGGSGNNTIAYSYDGIIWTGIGINIFSQSTGSIIFYNNTWYATGQGINKMAYSFDGIIWIPINQNILTNYVRSIALNKNMMIAVGSGNNSIIYSYTGDTWYLTGLNIFDIKGIGIVTNNIIWIALGQGTINTMAYSYDGINWIGLGFKIFSDYAKYAIWDGIKFIAVGSGTNSIAYSYDGVNWTGIEFSNSESGLGLSYNGTFYLSIGTFGTAISNDGINWSLKNFNNINVPVFVESRKSIQNIYYDNLINAGTYTIVPGGLYGRNYYITYKYGITNITKGKLQICHINYNKTYNALPFNNFGVTYTGFMNLDSSMNLIGELQYYSNDDTTNVGTYFITPSGLLAINYDIKYNAGELDVIAAPLVIRANNNIMSYNKLAYIPSYTVYGLLQNDTIQNLSGSLLFAGSYQNNFNVGTYNILLSGLSSLNYNIKYIQGTIQIVPAPLFIIANNDNIIYYNDISNYLLIYNPLNFKFLNNSIQALYDDLGQTIIKSLNGYEGSCQLSFSPPDNLCSIGLVDNTNSYIVNTKYDGTKYYISIIENSQIFNFGYITPNDPNTTITIKYQNHTLTYYLNGTILRKINRSVRNKLFINLFLNYANQVITNIMFTSIQEYYSGGNGFYCDGFQGNDTIFDLSGFIIYSGTSQNASNEGIYTIIPSGLSSKNYNITYVNGYLTIKKSKQK